jgi:organic radical activating enzyme
MQIKTVNNFVNEHMIIEYELFTLCDKSCTYCYNVVDTGGKRYNNPIDEVLRGLKRIIEMDNKKIIIQLIGGEVMLHKHFAEIIDYLYINSHSDHKFTLFTHADHPPEFFKSRIDLLKKFGDRVRISCTLHTQELNRAQFMTNIAYVDKTFEHSNLFFFTDNNYLKDLETVKEAIESTVTMKLFPIILDDSDAYTTAVQLVNMNTKFDEYLDRMDTTYIIDGQAFPYNKGKYKMVRDTNLTYTGKKCTVRAYEIDRAGDVTMSCFETGQQPIANIFRNPSRKLLDGCSITCKQKRCNMNLVNFEVADES